MSLPRPLKSARRHGLHRQAIVETLLKDIFQGRLPAGQRLVTEELAIRFAVSHTPVREALIALAGTGVVDLWPNRGAVVHRLTPKDIREICQVRRVLECAAVRRACGRIDLAKLRVLARQIRRLESAKSLPHARLVEQARATDGWLHDLIAQSCGNAFLAQEIGRLKTLFRAFRDAAWAEQRARNDYHRFGDEFREHLAIIDALLAGDRRAGAKAMAWHILVTAKYWRRAWLNLA